MASLPVIDLRPLAGGEPADRARVVAHLDAACRDTGFFLVEGHGIPDDVRARVFDAAQRLFALDGATKAAMAIHRSSCHRGYVGFGSEVLDPGTPGDLKEAFELSADLGPDHPEVLAGTPLHGPNQWPALPGFREAVEDYYAAALAAACLVVTGLALALERSETFFTDRMRPPLSNLRLLHYPPQSAHPPAPGQPGCGEHSDYGMVTLLAEDAVGGLEVRHRSGEWVRVHAEPHQLVVNLGDLLARWSGGRWVSTLHRVRNPASVDRYSIPFFVNPGFHEVVEPADARLRHDPAFTPVTAGAYLLSRFDETHEYRSP